MFKYYFLSLGIFHVFLGLIELFAPMKSYRVWEKWISHRFFFIHGLLLIAAGFPLTIYRGYLSRLIFFIGLFIVLTGPFILLYPEKFRSSFEEAGMEFKETGIRKIVYFDSIMRITAGLIFLVSCYKTFYS